MGIFEIRLFGIKYISNTLNTQMQCTNVLYVYDFSFPCESSNGQVEDGRNDASIYCYIVFNIWKHL